MSKKFKNPILSGFYPDPSICRVDEDYYLVTSSFEYFPGLPIFHSKDLVNWTQIGHVLDRPEQLALDGIRPSGGLYAPTIRYNNGKFYVINTLIDGLSNQGNFIVTAENPEGPWSNPVWIADAPGIDPSLFFDDDGKIWYTGNREPVSGEKYEGHREIWLQELDPVTFQLKGERYGIFDGALKIAIHPEAPHLYKKDGYYYILIAEGGTAHEHAVTIARSKTITGPYEANLRNPILTHRHLGLNYPIVGTGHADLIETHNNEWWMVALAMRPYDGYYFNLGRETFLVPVIWEDGWPVVSPGTGKIEWEYNIPNLPLQNPVVQSNYWDFKSNKLDYCWNFLRTPRGDFWTCGEDGLTLLCKKDKISENSNPAFICQRQRHINMEVQTELIFNAESENEEAGIVILQNKDFHYKWIATIKNNSPVLNLIEVVDAKEKVIFESNSKKGNIILGIRSLGQEYEFFYKLEDGSEGSFKADGKILSTPVAGGFVGAYMGLYAGSNGVESKNSARFKCFSYNPKS